MKLVTFEIRRSFSKRTLEIIFIWISLTICFSFLSIALANMQILNTSTKKYEKNISSKLIYKISDSADEDQTFSYFFETDEGRLSVYNLLNDLQSHPLFSYYSIDLQPLLMVDSSVDLPDYFGYTYEAGITDDEFSNQIKSIQLSQSVLDEFGIGVEDNYFFNSDDYIFDREKPVAVILGNDYKPFYSVGDTFTADFLAERLEFVVKGFFVDHALLPAEYDLIDLNRYMAIPLFSDFKIEQDALICKALKFDSVNGNIVTKDSTLNVQEELNKLSVKNGTFSFSVNQWEGEKINSYKTISDENAKILFYISTLMIIISALSFSVLFTQRVYRNRAIYSIYLISGYSQKHILSSILIEELIVLVSSLVIPLFVLLSMASHKILLLSLITCTLIVLIILTTSYFPIIKLIKKVNLAQNAEDGEV